MSKWSIRSKIIALVAFLLVVMAGLGTMAVKSMEGINAHTVEIATNWLPSVRVLGAISSQVNNYRFQTRGHLLADTEAGKD